MQRSSEALTEVDAAVNDCRVGEKFALRRLRVSILMRADKFAEAEAECQALLKEYTLPPDVLEIRYLLSGVYSAAGCPAQSAQELLECLRIDADSIAVNNDLGYLWADQNKNLPEAEEMIRKAIEFDRKDRKNPLPGARIPTRNSTTILAILTAWVGCCFAAAKWKPRSRSWSTPRR